MQLMEDLLKELSQNAIPAGVFGGFPEQTFGEITGRISGVFRLRKSGVASERTSERFPEGSRREFLTETHDEYSACTHGILLKHSWKFP